MLFDMLPERLRRLILICTLPAFGLSACTTSIAVTEPPAPCSTLIPSSLREKTPGAPVPQRSEMGEWVAFGSAQTGQLSKANGDKSAAIEIVEACEARDAAARQATLKNKRLKL